MSTVPVSVLTSFLMLEKFSDMILLRNLFTVFSIQTFFLYSYDPQTWSFLSVSLDFTSSVSISLSVHLCFLNAPVPLLCPKSWYLEWITTTHSVRKVFHGALQFNWLSFSFPAFPCVFHPIVFYLFIELCFYFLIHTLILPSCLCPLRIYLGVCVCFDSFEYNYSNSFEILGISFKSF